MTNFLIGWVFSCIGSFGVYYWRGYTYPKWPLVVAGIFVSILINSIVGWGR